MKNNRFEILLMVLCVHFSTASYLVGRAHSETKWLNAIKAEKLVYYDVDKNSGETTLKWIISDKPVMK